MNTHLTRGLSTLAALLSLCTLAGAQSPTPAAPSASAAGTSTDAHPWVVVPMQARDPVNYITNLRDGQKLESPFLLKFGLTRQGLANISQEVQGAGHHHLLINRDLPLDFTKPLPFNDQYVHFGKGQMEAVLNLKPGTYRLRMLLANHKHIPYFIYSPAITVHITQQRPDVKPESLTRPGISLLAPQAGDVVKRPFRVQMHASGLNVSHTQIQSKEAGHFQLLMKGASGTETLDFNNGHTEAWVKPPAGTYQLRLQYVNNASLKVTHESPWQSLTVQ
ncbi:MAG: hypothetical protein RLZZ182_2437 [Pseudomonadota bacterium]|jgi:hypothetical protein